MFIDAFFKFCELFFLNSIYVVEEKDNVGLYSNFQEEKKIVG